MLRNLSHRTEGCILNNKKDFFIIYMSVYEQRRGRAIFKCKRVIRGEILKRHFIKLKITQFTK